MTMLSNPNAIQKLFQKDVTYEVVVMEAFDTVLKNSAKRTRNWPVAVRASDVFYNLPYSYRAMDTYDEPDSIIPGLHDIIIENLNKSDSWSYELYVSQSEDTQSPIMRTMCYILSPKESK